METETSALIRNKVHLNRPPFFVMNQKDRLILIEDIEPLNSKEESKKKIKELYEFRNNIKLRSLKFKGQYFIYRKKQD